MQSWATCHSHNELLVSRAVRASQDFCLQKLTCACFCLQWLAAWRTVFLKSLMLEEYWRLSSRIQKYEPGKELTDGKAAKRGRKMEMTAGWRRLLLADLCYSQKWKQYLINSVGSLAQNLGMCQRWLLMTARRYQPFSTEMGPQR